MLSLNVVENINAKVAICGYAHPFEKLDYGILVAPIWVTNSKGVGVFMIKCVTKWQYVQEPLDTCVLFTFSPQ